jgi:uncharacterized protein (TIRG00374 family)
MRLKEKLISILKVVLPVGFGIWLIWFLIKDLSEEDKASIINSFKEANYYWVALAGSLSVISHLSRAIRWKIMINSMNLNVKISNSFYAVAIGYLANLLLPRLGEVSRCAVLAKHEGLPLEKLFGTVIAERIIDSIGLLILIFLTVFTQYSYINDFLQAEILPALNEKMMAIQQDSFKMMIVFGISAILILALIWFVKNKFSQLFDKIKTIVGGFAEGIKTVLVLKKPFWFIFHSIFIWVLYFLMMYVMFFAIKETADITLGAALSVFVLGGLTFIVVQGGIGAYPAVVTQVMMIYGYSKTAGFTFGWLAWTGQTLMIILLGLLAFLMLMISAKSNKTELK